MAACARAKSSTHGYFNEQDNVYWYQTKTNLFMWASSDSQQARWSSQNRWLDFSRLNTMFFFWLHWYIFDTFRVYVRLKNERSRWMAKEIYFWNSIDWQLSVRKLLGLGWILFCSYTLIVIIAQVGAFDSCNMFELICDLRTASSSSNRSICVNKQFGHNEWEYLLMYTSHPKYWRYNVYCQLDYARFVVFILYWLAAFSISHIYGLQKNSDTVTVRLCGRAWEHLSWIILREICVKKQQIYEKFAVLRQIGVKR